MVPSPPDPALAAPQPPSAPPLLSEASGPRAGGTVSYTRATRQSVVPGETLAAYAWALADPAAERAHVLLVHGFRSHTRYNFLASSPHGLHDYGAAAAPPDDLSASSFVRELNLRGFSVHGHDHSGHGASTGLKTFFPTVDALVDDVLAHARDIVAAANPKPLYIFGHSLGGSVTILAAMRDPSLFAGMCLSSAASEPPADMLGWYGLALSKVSRLASFLIPTFEVMAMPKNTRHPDLQALFESDPLNSMVMVRARVGHEFLCAYKKIADSLDKVTVPFLTMSGKHDTLVNPTASTRFFQGASSTDKEMLVQDCWHNLLVEPGRELNWRLYCDWLDKRAPASPHAAAE
jgi:acylglycerol lipase